MDNTTPPGDTDSPKLVQAVIAYSGGLIKDQKHANYVLVGFVLIIITISLFIVFDAMREAKFDPNDYPYGIVSPDET
jgi:hypothetical protein